MILFHIYTPERVSETVGKLEADILRVEDWL